MSPIANVLVGSRLHGLATPTSDYDERCVVCSPVRLILDPFTEVKPSRGTRNPWDQVEFELNHFVKHLTHGNPTMLEILWSTEIREAHPAWHTLREHRRKVLNTRSLYKAHRGYARNQRQKMEALVFEGEMMSPQRRGKFAAATIRTLLQGYDLVRTGTFDPNVMSRPWEYVELMQRARQGITPEDVVSTYLPIIRELDRKLQDAFDAFPDQFSPDYAWLTDFVYETYKETAL